MKNDEYHDDAEAIVFIRNIAIALAVAVLLIFACYKTASAEPPPSEMTRFYSHPTLGIIAVYENRQCPVEYAHPDIGIKIFAPCRKIASIEDEYLIFCDRKRKKKSHGRGIKHIGLREPTMYRKDGGAWMKIKMKIKR